jgi:uncharacterized protein YdeI (YjbR/CyaY-like superfamily)
MRNGETYPILTFETPYDWEMWLEQHHSEVRGVWLKFAKKASGLPSITYEEALDAALCYG